MNWRLLVKRDTLRSRQSVRKVARRDEHKHYIFIVKVHRCLIFIQAQNHQNMDFYILEG